MLRVDANFVFMIRMSACASRPVLFLGVLINEIKMTKKKAN